MFSSSGSEEHSPVTNPAAATKYVIARLNISSTNFFQSNLKGFEEFIKGYVSNSKKELKINCTIDRKKIFLNLEDAKKEISSSKEIETHHKVHAIFAVNDDFLETVDEEGFRTYLYKNLLKIHFCSSPAHQIYFSATCPKPGTDEEIQVCISKKGSPYISIEEDIQNEIEEFEEIKGEPEQAKKPVGIAGYFKLIFLGNSSVDDSLKAIAKVADRNISSAEKNPAESQNVEKATQPFLGNQEVKKGFFARLKARLFDSEPKNDEASENKQNNPKPPTFHRY